MQKYIITGVQGSGKGTQAKLLARDLDLAHISIGDIFRWNIQNKTLLAAKVKRIVASGALVPDEIVNVIVAQRLSEHDWNYGFILDGFPRDVHQAEFFQERYDCDAVIHIQVPDKVVTDRILARRLCSKCGKDYNLLFTPPRNTDTCDVCASKLVTRPDDNPQAVRDRINDYHAKTEPVLALFRKKGRVLTVDGTQNIDGVYQEIKAGLGVTK